MSRAPGPLLDVGEVRERARATLGLRDAGSVDRIADTLHRLSGGWQDLVQSALEDGFAPWELPDDPVHDLSRPGGPVARWLQDGLLTRLSPGAGRLLCLLRELHPCQRELVVAADPADAASYDELLDVGVLVSSAGHGLHVIPLVAAAAAQLPAPDDAVAWHSAAACWYLAADQPGAGLRAARYAGDLDRCREVIETFGDRLVVGGWCAEVLACAALLPEELGSTRTRILAGHAARMAGRPQQARRLLERALDDLIGARLPVPADLPWRLGLVHYGLGEHTRAIACCRGSLVPLDPHEPPEDRARRLACLSSSLRARGDTEPAIAAAQDAVAAAEESDSRSPEVDAALATARLAHAVLMAGARRQNLLARALTEAEHAGDLFLVQRALVNLADAHLIAADYEAARDATQRALDLVDRTGPVGCFTVGLHNKGEALIALGDLPGARIQFLRCLDLARRHGLERTPAALGGLAEVDYQAGRLDDARLGYQEAADLARDCEDSETLVLALGRLATILVARDPAPDVVAAARRLAQEAVDHASDEQRPAAVLAAGWVGLAAGGEKAAWCGDLAVEAARSGQVRRALGEALELRAACSQDGRATREDLEEAIDVHDLAGARTFADRARVSLGLLPGATRTHQTAARAAARRLRMGGFAAGPLNAAAAAGGPHLEIRVLGHLQVLTDGKPVPATAWRSRKARTLLKILVARHGVAVPREELCDWLWPGDDLRRASHRLAVLLSSLRSALDPGRLAEVEHFIAGDASGLRLSGNQIQIDLRDFLADADEAARLADAGEEASARRLLAEVLAEHVGDAFEDERYEAWTGEARDNVRAVRIRSLRLLARLAGRAGDIDEAVTSLVRLLGIDPFDEPAHQLLVAVLVRAQRHGEAQRAFDRWTRATLEIGVRPPDPSVLEATPGGVLRG